MTYLDKEHTHYVDLYKNSLHRVEQESGLKNLILEKKLEILEDNLEIKEVQNMIKTYEAKLAEFGIPVEEIGFEPLLPVSEVKTVSNQDNASNSGVNLTAGGNSNNDSLTMGNNVPLPSH